MPSRPVRLLTFAVLLAGLAVALVVWAVSAYQYAATVHGWRSTNGVVVQPYPGRSTAALRFVDSAGAVHLMRLRPGDTDDRPVGSVIRVSYVITASGRVRSEFRVQPGARASALTVMALLAAALSGVASWRWRVERTPVPTMNAGPVQDRIGNAGPGTRGT